MALNMALHGLAAALAYARSGIQTAPVRVLLLRAELAATALANASGEDDPTAIGPRLDALAASLLICAAADDVPSTEALTGDIVADLRVVTQRLGLTDDAQLAELLAQD